MSQIPSKPTKENFTWMPLFSLAIFDLMYLNFVIILMLILIIGNDSMIHESNPLKFISRVLILDAWGSPVILGSIVCGACTGLITAFFRKKPLSSSLKKKIVYFLICFYLVIGFALFYLMSLPPNPVRS